MWLLEEALSLEGLTGLEGNLSERKTRRKLQEILTGECVQWATILNPTLILGINGLNFAIILHL